MAFAMTSIFLFCFIIGTSVFPDGGSTRLAYAKPSSEYISQGLKELENLIGNQVPLKDGSRTYGFLTNQFGKEYVVNGVTGDITIGSTVNQKSMDFTDNQSPEPRVYGAITNQGYNSYKISNVRGSLTVGSNTYQENNNF